MEEKEKTDRDKLNNIKSKIRAGGKKPKPLPVKVEYDYLKRPVLNPIKNGEAQPKLTREEYLEDCVYKLCQMRVETNVPETLRDRLFSFDGRLEKID